MNWTIDTMQTNDWEQVRSIYLEGISTGHATFETQAPTWEVWNAGHLPKGRLVARGDSAILGWAALSPVSGRCVYAGLAEVSVYVGAKARNQRIGCALLKKLIEVSEQDGIWTLQAGIFPENTASLALHFRCGFEEVGLRKRIGKLHGVWRDVVLLERRSTLVGTT